MVSAKLGAMRTNTAGTVFLSVIAILALGCGQKEKSSADKTEAEQAGADERAAVANALAEQQKRPEEVWIPGEHKSGKGRWKDAGAYVDGVPVGMFWFGELPSTLKPVWVEEIEGLDFLPGDPPPYEKVVRVRRYRFSDYFEAVGVKLEDIKELHVYGPNRQFLVVTGEEFLQVKDYFYFRFGLGTHGKAIAVIPKDLGKNFDRLMAAAVYIKKKPPAVGQTEDGDPVLLLDGKPIEGIPYFGEPRPGGIRVYKDDRLVAVIKRNKLDLDAGETGADGEVRWDLLGTLQSLGVTTTDIVQAEVIYDERRTVRFERTELESMKFRSVSKQKGLIQLNDKTPAHALTFYSKPLPKKMASK